MAIPDPAAQERIVVAVDASPTSLLALELAADLAAALRTSLAGLYVEEEHLLHAAGLPFVRSACRVRAGIAVHHRRSAEPLAALASDARNALTRAAQARRIAWRFDVVRDRASQVMSEAAHNARLTGLGSSARAASRLGSVARAALVATESSLLLVAPALEALGQAALAGMSGAAQMPRMALPELAELPALVAILRAQRAQGLILAADSRFADTAQVERLVADGGWPVLPVR